MRKIAVLLFLALLFLGGFSWCHTTVAKGTNIPIGERVSKKGPTQLILSLSLGKDAVSRDFEALERFTLEAENRTPNDPVQLQIDTLENGWFNTDSSIFISLPGTYKQPRISFPAGVYRISLSCEKEPYTQCRATARAIGNVRPYIWTTPSGQEDRG